MSRSSPPLVSDVKFSSQNQISELTRTNELLLKKLQALQENYTRLKIQLAEAQVNSQSDRQGRRAALNLMEDAVSARAAEQRENAERRRVEEELRDANRRKDEFLAMLAHELRNPLAPIRNCVHILRMNGADATANEHVCEMLDRQVGHMVRLVDDLLEISRITHGQIELQKERLALADVVRNAVEISTPLLEAGHHRFDITLPDEPIFIEADAVRITQVFANLINNAAKYTPEEGQISLIAEREDGYAAIKVRDNGIGIPADMLPRIFDLFIQVDQRENRFPGGLGIGLTLVERLVQLHDGNISASSSGSGCGSEFAVRLPLALEKTSHAKPKMLVNREGNVVTRRVLIVDDNRDAAQSLAMLLKTLGSEVTVMHDGQSALRALEEQRPAVMLLDIGMPEMDGYEVARRVRRSSAGQGVMLIALTGWGQDDDRRRSKEAGFDHHLVKPVELHDLKAILNAPARETFFT